MTGIEAEVKTLSNQEKVSARATSDEILNAYERLSDCQKEGSTKQDVQVVSSIYWGRVMPIARLCAVWLDRVLIAYEEQERRLQAPELVGYEEATAKYYRNVEQCTDELKEKDEHIDELRRVNEDSKSLIDKQTEIIEGLTEQGREKDEAIRHLLQCFGGKAYGKFIPYYKGNLTVKEAKKFANMIGAKFIGEEKEV